MNYAQLTEGNIAQLVSQGCAATDWRKVTVSQGCDLKRIHNAQFAGSVRIGDNSGTAVIDGVELPHGIYGASLANCEVGNHVRIANIGSVVSNYVIEDNVVMQDVAALTADVDASFGNGVELEAVNEGGGRRIRMLNELTSQTAYLQAMLRHNPVFTKKLDQLVDAEAKEAISGKGRVSAGARIVHCGMIHNVNIGPNAFVHGAQFLENGTVNSCSEDPSEVGEGVQAKSFILSEGARVESGSMLDKAFVGQGVKMGKQYSAENSLFFANCEAFHGEAVSLFAGPYTVTHHKSTLLIAGLFSFYNAGSGTNQSNHMYKLGPVHQGILERGSKTGSFSYMLLETHIGAFSVVIGKHYANLDLSDLPFSYVFEVEEGSKVVPAMNLVAVGTVRDGEKWPKRDGRKAPKKRDLIVFDVYSPYTVEKMRHGKEILHNLGDNCPADKELVEYGGAIIGKTSLKKGVKYYELAVNRYLCDKLIEKVCEASTQHKNWSSLVASLKPASKLRNFSDWTDVGGLLMPTERLAALEESISSGVITSYDALVSELQMIYDSYRHDEWKYVYETYTMEFGVEPTCLTKDGFVTAVETWEASASALQSSITEDSKKEFGAFAQIGFGLDQSEDNKRKDFEAVRGTIDSNSVVQQLAAEGAALKQRKEQLKQLVSSLSI